jgi:hypothetical protein
VSGDGVSSVSGDQRDGLHPERVVCVHGVERAGTASGVTLHLDHDPPVPRYELPPPTPLSHRRAETP